VNPDVDDYTKTLITGKYFEKRTKSKNYWKLQEYYKNKLSCGPVFTIILPGWGVDSSLCPPLIMQLVKSAYGELLTMNG